MESNDPIRPLSWTESNRPTRRNSTATLQSRESPQSLSEAMSEKQQQQQQQQSQEHHHQHQHDYYLQQQQHQHQQPLHRLHPLHDKELGLPTATTTGVGNGFAVTVRGSREAGGQPSQPHQAFVNDEYVDPYDRNRPKVGFRQRMHHFTWAWYTFPMSTGGLSLLIYSQPNQFHGLRTIGLVVYIINIVLFAIITALMTARFFLHPGDLTRSLKHPREGFFFPTFFLATATIITSTERYAVPANDSGLKWAIQAAFWTYLALTLILSVGQYSFVFAAHSFGLQTMMPTWILPIFPIMLTGTIASVIANTQPDIAAVPILIAGLSCQGLGFSVAVLMYSHMVGRLMQSGLPDREHRPGLFMCVGPPAFTALAVIGMANGLPDVPGPVPGSLFLDVGVMRTIAVVVAVFLWSLSLWWFAIALVAVIQSPPRHFHLGWWAMVFPNTGFTLATIAIGKEIGNDHVMWVTTAMSIGLVLVFAFVLFHHVRAVIVQDIMYPGRDEDVEEKSHSSVA